MAASAISAVRALLFDVFGTCVDWRTSIIREGEAFGRAHGVSGVDWAKFADAWRALYQPQMDKVRTGQRSWTPLDDLHRESLHMVLDEFGIIGIPDADVDAFNRAWHRLDPWPDTIEGLARLKAKYIVAPNSNGNVALILNMAKRAGIPWDAILGAEIARAYKPTPQEYLRNVEILGLTPPQVMMVAAHNSDLVAARACGLLTGFVARPAEHGPGQTADLGPEHPYDVVATDFIDLARRMGCSSIHDGPPKGAPMAISASTRIRLATQLDALAIIQEGANARFAEIRPADGGWSAKENVAHLARHAHVFLERMDRVLREERPNLGTYRPEQDQEWTSWRTLPLAEAVLRAQGARARLIAWVEGLSEEQARRVGIHPLLGEMDVGRWLEFFLLHEAHHLYFMLRRLGQARHR